MASRERWVMVGISLGTIAIVASIMAIMAGQ
jgi:hypothetical protein